MATKERESDAYFFLNPPQFIGINRLRLETPAHPNGELINIIGMNWNGKEHWLLPRLIGQNNLECGLVYLYLKRGRRLYTADLVFQPLLNEFYIQPPEFKKEPKGRLLIIQKISACYCVDINFLKDEDKRLWARKYTMTKEDLIKIPRPKSAHIV